MGEYLKIKKKQFLEQLFVIKRYYPKSTRFACADLCLQLLAFAFNPYRVSRKFLQKKGEKNIYAYGETSLKTLHKIASFGELSAEDVFLDLGSGRGKGCFWVASFVGCKVIGVEWVPLFVRCSQALAKICRFRSVQFFCKSFYEIDFSEATFVYLYGTSMQDAEIEKLLIKMENGLKAGAKVVTVSEPLPRGFSFKEKKRFPLEFPWGVTDAYLHIKTPSKGKGDPHL